MKWTGMLLMLWPLLAGAEIYRWVDDNGRVRFSDQPPSQQTAKKVEVNDTNFYQPRVPESLPALKKRPSKKRRSSPAKPQWDDGQCRTAKLRARRMSLNKTDGNLQQSRERRERLRQLRERIRARC
ncbi:hypothetical protein GCM10011297_02020 [Bacterioplanes sanyensis]|uniref:DUF4124 domain-containing protein n=1 Tax=Bacterioplanes sanyensis TaxID=1249553 RepID=UPI00167A4ECE|nr:DUF4124 domain-containing protein [Bacterioplanes sanyensis]GGY32688.1 hypothetical protein GCM10011297_02020 [Bacterioplanes sanyensis]